jgi:transposase
MDASQKSDLDESGERGSRRFRSLEEKLAILKEADEPGASVAAVARQHGMNANLLFGWRRLRQAGLLEKQRYSRSAPLLLPVKITTPTLTPTRRMGKRTRKSARVAAVESPTSASGMEIMLSDGVRIRLSGEAGRMLLERLLERLSRR